MLNEKNKAVEYINGLNKEGLETANIFLKVLSEKECYNKETPAERLKELQEKTLKEETEKAQNRKEQMQRLKVNENQFTKLKETVLDGDSINGKTFDFMRKESEMLRDFILMHPDKLVEVIEVIHTRGVKDGQREKRAKKKATI